MATHTNGFPPPKVYYDEKGMSWVDGLEGIWRIAQADEDAFRMLERSIAAPRDDITINEQLVHHVRSFQPPEMREGFDAYTMVVLRGIWDNACKNPTALDELLSIRMNFTKYKRAHQELAWSISKLSKNADFRIREPGASPISELPVEILRYIFEELRMAWPRYPQHYGQDLWDRASHLVCRKVSVRFRDTVDDATSVWASMALDFGPDMIAFAIERTRRTPLDIVVPFGHNPTHLGPSAAKIIKHILPQHMPRVRSLQVITKSSEETDKFLALLAATPSAPALETFYLHPGFYSYDPRHVCTISSTTFSDDPPLRLQSLVVHDTALSHPSSLLQPSLVRLDLLQSQAWESLSDMISTLGVLQGLKKLAWRMPRSALNHSDGENVRPIESFLSCSRPSIELPSLQEVKIQSPIAFASALFSYIINPGTCSVSLHDDYTLMDSESESVLDDLRSNLGKALGPHLQWAYDSGPRGTCVELRLMQLASVFHVERNSLCIVGMRNSAAAARLSLPLFCVSLIYKDAASTTRQGPHVFPHLLEEIVHWKGISESTSLWVANPAVSHHRQWKVLLGALPKLSSLELTQNSRCDSVINVSGLAQALASPDLVPSISRITLRSFEIPLPMQRELALAVSRHYTQGRPRVALRLHHCTFDIRRLKMVLLAEGKDKIYYDQR